jgi:hypothetical protein
VVLAITSIEVNLLLTIFLMISLAEPKAKSEKMSPTDPVEEKRKLRPRLRQNRGYEKEEENLGMASLKDISDTHLLPYSAAILDCLPNKMDDPGVPTISCLIGT